jgi:murein DD-endopeptidase MepM/ murein hydrolase activator NlpD
MKHLISKHNNTKNIYTICIVGLLLITGTTSVPQTAYANEDKIQELQADINTLNTKLDDINKAIKEAESKVASSAAEAQSIAAKVKTLEASRKKIEKDISYTETQIKRSKLEIEKLGYEITDKQVRISKNNTVLGESLKELAHLESTSFLETLLTYNNMSEFWNHLQAIQSFQDKIQGTVLALQDLSVTLKTKKQSEEDERIKLESSKKLLSGEHEAIATTKQKEQELLTVAQRTEQQQREYLAQQLKEKQEFESAMLEYESQLKTLIDPSSIPTGRKGIFGWPLDTIRITQLFGGTEFSKNNPQLYSRPFHNGVDFGIPLGSKVYSVMDGVVMGTGNTDAFPNCRSWGKWVLVKHNNGLTTLYAHLSSILVTAGDSVSKGQTIALSGSTGISTGPHLHLTVYASQGVEIIQYNLFKPGSTGCAATAATIPVAPLDAYIDPSAYLPEL